MLGKSRDYKTRDKAIKKEIDWESVLWTCPTCNRKNAVGFESCPRCSTKKDEREYVVRKRGY